MKGVSYMVMIFVEVLKFERVNGLCLWPLIT